MITSPDLDTFTLNKSLNFSLNPNNGAANVVHTLIFDAVSCGGIVMSSFPALQDFECPNLTDAGNGTNPIVITGQTNLQTVNFPSLVNYNSSQTFNVSANPVLTAFLAPNWTGFVQNPGLSGLLDMHNNTALAAISLPSFVRFNTGCTFAGCASLASIDIPFDTVTFTFAVRATFTLNFSNCALPTDEVNRLLVLIRNNSAIAPGIGGNTWNVLFVGPNNGVPSGDGLVAKQDLIGRGVHVSTN